MQNQSNPTRILRLKEVLTRVSLCKAMIYRLQAQGRFPKSVKLGERATGWYEHDIEAWLSNRANPTTTSGEVRHA